MLLFEFSLGYFASKSAKCVFSFLVFAKCVCKQTESASPVYCLCLGIWSVGLQLLGVWDIGFAVIWVFGTVVSTIFVMGVLVQWLKTWL